MTPDTESQLGPFQFHIVKLRNVVKTKVGEYLCDTLGLLGIKIMVLHGPA